MTDAPKAPRAEARAGEDPYAWLRDEQWQAVIADPAKLSPAIRAYLEAENAYTDRVLAPLASLRTALVAEMRATLEKLIRDGRSTPGDSQRNDVEVVRHPRPEATAAKAKGKTTAKGTTSLP